MAQHKGHTKIGGRVKGTPNLTTRQAKEVLNKVLFAEIEHIQEALAGIRRNDPGKYLDVMARLLAYSLPRKTDITSEDEVLPPAINITVTSTESMKQLQDFLNDETAANYCKIQ